MAVQNMKGCLKKQLTSQMDMAESLGMINLGLKMANSKITAGMDIVELSSKMATMIIKNTKMAGK